ncbi:helix-turn-helix transcriptional regulator [Yinghuangia aomiensis]|uniref:Helix-turn-helix transcriptional regulator n=1 Tax=Yinghuangia aomiensis TaxID=676205 RepID=A0ABP9GU09_9ACTN
MPEYLDPLVAWRRLHLELRRLREVKGDTQQQVADAMEWSLSKLIRIETGRIRISVNDLRVLTGYYGLPDDVRNELLALARDSRKSAWWEPYRDVISKSYAEFIAFESVASVVRCFSSVVVPGLLQTEEYAWQVMEAAGMPDQLARRLVELRMKRQEMWRQATSVDTRFLVDESVIRRVVGGPEVMRQQLQRLREVAELPNVSFKVVPYSEGLYRLHRVGYSLFQFPDDAPLVLYLDNDSSDMITTDVADERPVAYLDTYTDLDAKFSAEDATKIIGDALARLG